jgi:hypothetical protein
MKQGNASQDSGGIHCDVLNMYLPLAQNPNQVKGSNA